MRMQVGRALAAVVIAGAVLSGCGGPIQTGAAVVIGDSTISLDQAKGRIDSALAQPGVLEQARSKGEDSTDVARDVVSGQIQGNLVGSEAAAAHVVVSDAAVDADVAAQFGPAAVSQITPTIRESLRTQLIGIELGKRAVGATTVTVDKVDTRSRVDAERLAGILASGGPAADALFTDPTAKRGADYTAAANPDDAITVLFGVPQGATVVYQASPGNATWTVAKVTARSTDGKPDEAAASGLSQDQLLVIGYRSAQAVAAKSDVRVNPRFGVWDAVALRVVKPGDTAGLVILPG